jgi:hypothetical protein
MAATTSGGSRTEVKNQCPVCKKTVGRNDKGLLCEYCSKWHHCECEKILNDEYDFIVKRGRQLHWFCSNCNVKALDVIQIVSTIKEANDKLKVDMDSLTKRVDDIAKFNDKEFKANFRQKVRDEVYEAKDKEKRVCNIIISGIEELEDIDVDDDRGIGDKDNELEIVQHMINGVLNLPQVTVEKAEGIQPKRSGEERVPRTGGRLIFATLGNKDMKYRVLDKARDLRKKEFWNKVFINPDRTAKERTEDRELRDELKRRKEAGEKNLVIRKGQILHQTLGE